MNELVFVRPICQSDRNFERHRFILESKMMDQRECPKYFNLLNPSDQQGYASLQRHLNGINEKRVRGKRLSILEDSLKQIRMWSQRGDTDDWIRCLVCGVCYLKCGIAVNSHQLRYLTNKCKSSVNGALKLLGYQTISARGDTNDELMDMFPILKGNTHELRQWSVRAPKEYGYCSPEVKEEKSPGWAETKDLGGVLRRERRPLGRIWRQRN